MWVFTGSLVHSVRGRPQPPSPSHWCMRPERLMLVIIQVKHKHCPHGFFSSFHAAVITCWSCAALTSEDAEATGLMAINGEDGYTDKTFDLLQRGRGVPLEFQQHWKSFLKERSVILFGFWEMTAETWQMKPKCWLVWIPNSFVSYCRPDPENCRLIMSSDVIKMIRKLILSHKSPSSLWLRSSIGHLLFGRCFDLGLPTVWSNH